ncbi:MAG: VTT domain-containing protein [Dehalococcoidia bacterium]
MNEVAALLDVYGLLAIAVVLFLKEAGVPIPFPGDVLVIVAGTRAAAGAFGMVELVLVLLVAAVLGALIQYTLARGPARRLLYQFGGVVGLPPERLDRLSGSIGRRGPVGVAVGRLTPGVRTVVVIACGLAAMPLRRFLPGIVAGSGLFFVLHAALGFLAGPPIVAAVQGLNLPIVPIAVVVAVLGLVIWLMRRRQKGVATALAWADAGCPACALVGVASRAGLVDDGALAPT